MDIVTLGAALNGSAEYVNSHFKGGSNIQIVDNPDGTQTINASGEVSSEDTVARAEIAEMKDGENLDSFGDVETALGDKADTSTTYTKTEVDTALSAKANSADVYSKSDIDVAMSAKADKSTTYTKTEVNTALDDKVDKVSGKDLSTNDFTTAEKAKLAGIAEGAEVNVQSNWTQTTTTADDYIKNKPTLGTAAAKNATDTYNATGTDVTTGKAVAAALATLPEPMVFKGSLGTGGTITTLPTASSSNKGYVYKVITAGTYASQSAKVGDTFISDGSLWVLIPSGDEPSGTVTNVAVANGGGLTVSGSPITSSGTITVGHSNSVTAKTSSSLKKFTYDAYGHVTGSSELSTTESNALASGIDSTKVEQIETNKNNISSVQAQADWNSNNGVKNLLNYTVWKNGVTATRGTLSFSGNSVTLTATDNDACTDSNAGSGYPVDAKVYVKPNTKYILSWESDATNTKNGRVFIFPNVGIHTSAYATVGKLEITTGENTTFLTFRIGVANSGDSITYSNLMIRPAIISDTSYQPYAMSNAELTAKEQANQNNISRIQQLINTDITELSWTIKFPENTSSKVGTTTPIYLESGKTYSINNTYTYRFTAFIDGYTSVSVDIPSGQTENFTPSNSGYLRLYTSGASANTSAIINISRKEEKTDELQLYYIDAVSAENHFSTFSDCIKALRYNDTVKNIYVSGGVYDIYSEIGGSTFLATLSGNENWYDVNDIVPPNTTIIGVGNVVLEMKLPSTTSDNVAKLLSPINIRGTCSVENINIVAQNCRYCIHDETSGNTEFTGAVKKYHNVVCEKLTSTIGYPQAYAAGFDDDMVLKFENCTFKSYGEVWSAHNRSSSIDHSSKIIINNSAFVSSNTLSRAIRFGNMNKTQEKVEVMICNSYLSNDVLVRDEYTTTGLINAFAITMVGCGTNNCNITTSINDYMPEIYEC